MDQTTNNESENVRPDLHLLPPHTSDATSEEGERRMSAIEADRLDLYQSAARAMNQRAAETLMEHLPPLGWGDVARKSDILVLKEDNTNLKVDLLRLEDSMATKKDLIVIDKDIHNVRSEIRELKDELRKFKAEFKEFKAEVKEFKAEVKEFKAEVKEEFNKVRFEVKADIKDLRDDIKYSMRTMYGIMAAGFFTLIAAMITKM